MERKPWESIKEPIVLPAGGVSADVAVSAAMASGLHHHLESMGEADKKVFFAAWDKLAPVADKPEWMNTYMEITREGASREVRRALTAALGIPREHRQIAVEAVREHVLPLPSVPGELPKAPIEPVVRTDVGVTNEAVHVPPVEPVPSTALTVQSQQERVAEESAGMLRSVLKVLADHPKSAAAVPAGLLAGGLLMRNKPKETGEGTHWGTGKKLIVFGSGTLTLGAVANLIPGKTKDWIGSLAKSAGKAL